MAQVQTNDDQLLEQAAAIKVTRGRYSVLAEVIKAFVNLPMKLALWDSTVGSGELRDDSEQVIRIFLAMHRSTDTHISINEYNPVFICKRVFHSRRVSLLTKLTLGVLETVFYTLIPAKFLGMTYYASIADTIVICSDNLARALSEAGDAIDSKEQNRKGWRAWLYKLLPPYYALAANRAAITFAEESCERRDSLPCWKQLVFDLGMSLMFCFFILCHVTDDFWAAWAAWVFIILLPLTMIAYRVLPRVVSNVRTSRGRDTVNKDKRQLVERARYGVGISKQ